MARTFDTPLFSSDQSIDRVLNAGLPVVLVFTDSSTPAGLESALKTLASQEAGNLLVVQLNIKDNPQTVSKYDVHNAPAVVTLKNGQVQSSAGNVTAADLQAHARYLLGKGSKPEPKPETATAGAYAGGSTSAYRPQSQPASGGYSGEAGGQPVNVTDATFEQEVMRSPVPVVVDFWAPWCGPCRMVAPTLEKLAREWNGKVKIAKVNVDENPNIAGRYGITGIPTMLVVKNGQIADRWAGALPEPALRQRLGNNVR